MLPKEVLFVLSRGNRLHQNIERSGSDYGIERMRELLDLLGAPDRHLKFVHIAGTNGKGSVSAYLTSILKEAGYKVGTYNSPSVFCYNERWLINGQPLSDDDVAKYLTAVRECIESEQILRNAFGISEFKPTAFEIETAVAMLAFSTKSATCACLKRDSEEDGTQPTPLKTRCFQSLLP